MVVLGTAVMIGCNTMQRPASTPSTPTASTPTTTKPAPVAPTPSTPAPVTPTPVSSWVFCANEFSGCSFSGLRQVRYVLKGKATIKSFFGSADCKDFNFAVKNDGSSSAKCEYAGNYQTKTLPNPMPGMSGLGASVTVPLGHPGFSGPRVQPTDDRGAPSDIGAFRTVCDLSHFAFDDPIVFPGKPGASHLHMFFGNSSTSAFSTADSIAKSGNSSCAGGTLNRTAYWIPALIDGSSNVILPASAIFYYKTGYLGIKPADVKAMPPGLRMISGDGTLSSAQGQGHWGCNETYIGHKDSIQEVLKDPRCGPGNHAEIGIDFPQCWDGKNLDSSNHKSHMAWPVNGACPSTHPVPIPVISIIVRFLIPAGGAKGWHLSSDMYDYASRGGGFSAHADWWNGWDPATEKAFIENCNNPSKDCHGYLLGDGRTLF